MLPWNAYSLWAEADVDPAHSHVPTPGCLLCSAPLLVWAPGAHGDCGGRAAGAAPSCLHMGWWVLQGSQVSLFLVGPRKEPLSASSTPRHTQVDFSGVAVNVVVFLFAIKCCRNYCMNYTAEVYAHAWPKRPSFILVPLHLANSGSK